MANLCMSLCLIILCFFVDYCSSNVQTFDENYVVDWGAQHFTFFDQRREAQILIDQTSGGGFRSKYAYSSGYFQISLKIPKNSKGIIATFYLTSILNSAQIEGNHDELDFELLGGSGPGYILNTNVFAQDNGHREQQFMLWFDPTSAFHNYIVLWNSRQIVFYIDKIPIRVYKNNRGSKYPKLPMDVHATLWNGTQWLGPVEWGRGPFYANYRNFDVSGCKSNFQKCASSKDSWNSPSNWELSEDQKKVHRLYKSKTIRFDYCQSGRAKNLPECRPI